MNQKILYKWRAQNAENIRKISILILLITAITILSWLSRGFIPGHIFTLVLMSGAGILFFRMTECLNEKERKITEREKQLAEIQVEKMRANLLRAISHDLRTPLTSINGSCALMLEGSVTDRKKEELLKNIYEDSGWLIGMVENLLTITRVKGDELAIITTDELMEEVVSEAVHKIEKRYPGKKVNVSIPSDIIIVSMDAILIEQVIINLVENAIVHSGQDGCVDVSVRNTEHAVLCRIKDYGGGIPEDRMDEIFDGCAYSQSDAPDAYRGMGIGLSICKTIIAAHHGTIIGRNHSEGAEFIFTLPKE